MSVGGRFKPARQQVALLGANSSLEEETLSRPVGRPLRQAATCCPAALVGHQKRRRNRCRRRRFVSGRRPTGGRPQPTFRSSSNGTLCSAICYAGALPKPSRGCATRSPSHSLVGLSLSLGASHFSRAVESMESRRPVARRDAKRNNKTNERETKRVSTSRFLPHSNFIDSLKFRLAKPSRNSTSATFMVGLMSPRLTPNRITLAKAFGVEFPNVRGPRSSFGRGRPSRGGGRLLFHFAATCC